MKSRRWDKRHTIPTTGRLIYRLVRCLCLVLAVFSTVWNIKAEINSGTCEPYYVSIKSSKVNSHVGPGKNYKISFQYTQKCLPLLVVAKYDHWRKVKDPEGSEGWIHKSLLSPKRFVITNSETPISLMTESNDSSACIATIKKNVVMELISVRGNWCKVSATYDGSKYVGWIKKSGVFGVLNNETW